MGIDSMVRACDGRDDGFAYQKVKFVPPRKLALTFTVDHQLRLATSDTVVQLTMAIHEECCARNCTGGQLFVSL